MNEMVDRVAIAIFGYVEFEVSDETEAESLERQAKDEANGHFDYGPYISRQEMRSKARAAIEAMRELTYDMKFSSEVRMWPEDIEKTWTALIDEALKDRPKDLSAQEGEGK